MDDTNEIADALNNISASLDAVARALDKLGTAGAGTRMGAIELLALETKEGFHVLAAAIGNRE